jgi:hypothetical protein
MTDEKQLEGAILTQQTASAEAKTAACVLLEV